MQCLGAGMGEDDRRCGQGEHLIEGGIGGMRPIGDDTELVHLLDQRAAERAEPTP